MYVLEENIFDNKLKKNPSNPVQNVTLYFVVVAIHFLIIPFLRLLILTYLKRLISFNKFNQYLFWDTTSLQSLTYSIQQDNL